MVGHTLLGEKEQKTNIRFKNVADFETYVTAIDVDYDSEDVIFTGWVNHLNAPQFKIVKRSVYGKNTDFEQSIAELIGYISYIPPIKYCFIEM